MSDTPRTDAVAIAPNLPVTPAYSQLETHARQLERELAAAQWLISKVNQASWDDLKAQLAAVTVERDGYKHSANFHRDRGITLLDAKYLDPACHKGCQSLVWQEQVLAGIAAEDYAIKSHLITADLLEVTAAERDKLKGFYDEIVKELGHDCVLRELNTLRDDNRRLKLLNIFGSDSLSSPHDLYEVTRRDQLAALREDKADLDWLQRDPQNRFVRAISTWMKVGSNPSVITIRDAIRTVRKETP